MFAFQLFEVKKNWLIVFGLQFLVLYFAKKKLKAGEKNQVGEKLGKAQKSHKFKLRLLALTFSLFSFGFWLLKTKTVTIQLLVFGF